jgi:hypothetical protein
MFLSLYPVYCLCVNVYYCHRVSTQLQLNIYHTINTIDCVSCNGKVESHIIIITNVMIYRVSIVSVLVLCPDDSVILEPELVIKKTLQSNLLCVIDN